MCNGYFADKVLTHYLCTLMALPTKAKAIVFRFIIEYSSLRDFGSQGNNNRSIFI
jgi:hypothetical protein